MRNVIFANPIPFHAANYDWGVICSGKGCYLKYKGFMYMPYAYDDMRAWFKLNMVKQGTILLYTGFEEWDGLRIVHLTSQ